MNSQMMNTQKVQVVVTHAKAGMTITIKKMAYRAVNRLPAYGTKGCAQSIF